VKFADDRPLLGELFRLYHLRMLGLDVDPHVTGNSIEAPPMPLESDQRIRVRISPAGIA